MIKTNTSTNGTIQRTVLGAGGTTTNTTPKGYKKKTIAKITTAEKPTEAQLMNIISTKKAHFSTVQSTRKVKTKKNSPEIFKTTLYTGVRIGAEYDKMKSVQQGRQDGTKPEENQGLKGVEWVQFPSVLQNIKTLEKMLVVNNLPTSKSTVQWSIEGVEASYEQVEPYLYASEKTGQKVKQEVFRVKFKDIDILT